MNLKRCLCSSLLAAVSLSAVFVFAGTNDGANAKNSSSTNPSNAAAAAAEPINPNTSPNLGPSSANTNVTALLGVLVMKGVLAPAEANAIRDAAPEAEFQLLVEALNRKGLLSNADLSAAASPAAQPAAPAATPVAAPETTSASLASPDAEPSPQAAPAQQATPAP